MSTDGVVLKKARLMGEEAETEKEEERRRWEEMNMDCLANVFSKAGMESLILAVPFVCKTWYKASLSPMCWTCLYFPDYEPSPLFVKTVEEIEEVRPQSFGTFYDMFVDEYRIVKSRFSITAFVKLVVDRGQGKVTVLKLPMFSTEEALRYVSDACPLLEVLAFEYDLVIFKHSQILPEVIGKLKFLEDLYLGNSLMHIVMHMVVEIVTNGYFCKYFQELLTPESPSCYNVLERIIVQIGTHCKNFRQLNLLLVHLGPVEALAIVKFLPHLETINAIRCIIERDSLLTIVRGCKEFRHFYAYSFGGFEEDDEEIYKLSRQTGNVISCEGCDRHGIIESQLSNFTTLREFLFDKLTITD